MYNFNYKTLFLTEFKQPNQINFSNITQKLLFQNLYTYLYYMFYLSTKIFY